MTKKINMSVLQISQNACERLQEILSDDLSLLISVNPGGCNGFSYSFDITKEQSPSTVEVLEKPKVFVSSSAIEMLSGSILEYEANDIGTAFFSIKNPNATSKCGCGNSFSTF